MPLYDRLLPSLADISPEDPNDKLRKYLANSAIVAANRAAGARTVAQEDQNRLNKVLLDQEQIAAESTPNNPLLKRKIEAGDLDYTLNQQPRTQALSSLQLDYNTGATQGKIANLPLEVAADRSTLSSIPQKNALGLRGLQISADNAAPIDISGKEAPAGYLWDPAAPKGRPRLITDASYVKPRQGFPVIPLQAVPEGYVQSPATGELIIDQTYIKPGMASKITPQEEITNKLREKAGESGMKNYTTATPEELAEFMGKNARKSGQKLLQDQMKVLTNIDGAEFTLNEIESKLNQTAARGPVIGRVRGMNPYDEEAQSIERMVDSLVPGLARGVFGEVGVLTDRDVDRYKKMIPNMKSDPAVAKQIVEELRQKLKQTRESSLKTWDKSGYDVSNFTQNPAESIGELPTEPTDYPVYATPEEVPETVLYFRTPSGKLKQNPNFKE